MIGPGIHINNVSLNLQSHQVFDSLNLNFTGGQCHCVLGRSGVGKSCLLNLLSGLLSASSGSVSFTNEIKPNNQIAYMFQDDGLLPWLNVLDNVQLGQRLRGQTSSDCSGKAMDLLTKVDLAKWANHLPAELSGGMRQRVALARTLMEDRAIILMDEPFSRLDAITRNELQELACRLLNERTVILVTHDPDEALRIGHTVSVLHSSKPSTVTTFNLESMPPRARSNNEAQALAPKLWRALLARTENQLGAV